MAQETINEQTEDTSPTDDDFLLTWDVTSGITKKVTILNLIKKVLNASASDWAWQSFAPTLNTLTLGNGSLVAHYIQIGKTVHFRITLIWGSTTSIASGTDTFTLPATSITPPSVRNCIGEVDFWDNSASDHYSGKIYWASTTTGDWGNYLDSAAKTAGMNGTTPVTWAANDVFSLKGEYEAS